MDDKPELVYCSFNLSRFDNNVVQINWKNFFQLIDSLTKPTCGGEASLSEAKRTSLAVLRRYLKMAFRFSLRNEELVARCEHYLNRLDQLDLADDSAEPGTADSADLGEEVKRIEAEFSLVAAASADSATTTTSSLFGNDFPYFKLIKCVLLENDLVKKSGVQLRALMRYCLDKCRAQLAVFEADSATTTDQEPPPDSAQLLKANDQMNNFQLNLLNVLHFFKNTYDELPAQIAGQEEEKDSEGGGDFYDLMSPLVAIYLDVNLMIKARARLFKVIQFKTKKLKKFLCLNLFYLVDSCVYYACNTLLRMKSLGPANLEYVLPIVRKIVDLKCGQRLGNDEEVKYSNSLYLRILLVYRKLMLILEAEFADLGRFEEEAKLLEFFKWFIYSIRTPAKFARFVERLVENGLHPAFKHTKQLYKKVLKAESPRKLRKFVMAEMSRPEFDELTSVLLDRAYKSRRADASRDVSMASASAVVESEPTSLFQGLDALIDGLDRRPPVLLEDHNYAARSSEPAPPPPPPAQVEPEMQQLNASVVQHFFDSLNQTSDLAALCARPELLESIYNMAEYDIVDGQLPGLIEQHTSLPHDSPLKQSNPGSLLMILNQTTTAADEDEDEEEQERRLLERIVEETPASSPVPPPPPPPPPRFRRSDEFREIIENPPQVLVKPIDLSQFPMTPRRSYKVVSPRPPAKRPLDRLLSVECGEPTPYRRSPTKASISRRLDFYRDIFDGNETARRNFEASSSSLAEPEVSFIGEVPRPAAFQTSTPRPSTTAAVPRVIDLTIDDEPAPEEADDDDHQRTQASLSMSLSSAAAAANVSRIHPASFYRNSCAASANNSFDSLEFGLNPAGAAPAVGPRTFKLNDLVSIVRYDYDLKQKRKKFSPFDLTELNLDKDASSSSASASTTGLLTPPLSLRKEAVVVHRARRGRPPRRRALYPPLESTSSPSTQSTASSVNKDKYNLRVRGSAVHYESDAD